MSAVESNIVGYNTTQNETDPDVIFSAAFEAIGDGEVFPFNAIQVSGDGLEDEDYIETSYYSEEEGCTLLADYVYYTGEGWYDPDMELIDDTVGLKPGQSAWYLTSSAKKVTTAGQVYSKPNKIHTFTEPDTLVSSVYPVPFCPNSENVSWGVEDETYLETAYYSTEEGCTLLADYVYYNGEGWYDPDMNLMGPEDSMAAPGVGFWILLPEGSIEASSFTEVSPIE